MTLATRHAFRQLAQRPLWALVAVGTLALGIATVTAMFGILKPLLIESLPHPQAERLQVLAPYPWMHAEPVREFASAAGNDAVVAGYFPRAYAVRAGDRPTEIQGAGIDRAFPAVSGMSFRVGRAFADDDPAEVAVVTATLAQRLFGSVESALDAKLLVEGRTHRVIGVVDAVGPLPQLELSELWLPLETALHTPVEGPQWIIPLMRLAAPDAWLSAQTRLQAVLDRHLAQGAELPRSDYRWQTLREALIGDQGRQLLLLQAAVSLVLLLACLNVAALQMARAADRVGEIGLRRALGANRARLLRQWLLESVLLALAAGAVALVVLAFGMGALAAFLPAELLRFGTPQLDFGTALFAFAAALVAGGLSALLPACWASRVQAAPALREGARSVVGTRGGRRAGATLVAAEVALTLILLVAAGLLLRSLMLLSAQAPGFRSEGVLAMPLRWSAGDAESAAALDRAWQDLLERVAAVPGVASAALANRVPLARGGTTRLFVPEGESEPRLAQHGIVSPDYFRTLDVPLLRGRIFDDADRRGSKRVTVIDAALWRQLWPEEDPIGRRMRLFMGGDDHWLTVVGVVGDIRGSGLAAAPAPGFYIPHAQRPEGATSLALGREAVILVQADGSPDALSQALREAVWSAYPRLPIPEVRGLDTILRDSLAPQRFRALAVGVFAVLALVLAVAGVHAVVAQVVTRRMHEFGIRKALGANSCRLRGTVLRWASGAALVGVVVGSLGSALLAWSLAGFLFGVSAADPPTMLAAGTLLVVIVVGAAWGPARRAGRIDPMSALRES